MSERDMYQIQGSLNQSLETDTFNIEGIRVKKTFVVTFLVSIALLTSQFGNHCRALKKAKGCR